MQTHRALRLAAIGLFLLACTDAIAPRDAALVGHWASAPEDLSPHGWYQDHFTFTANGTVVREVRTYGVYDGQRRDQLSAYVRQLGTYRVEGDALILRATRSVWWDSFYGADSPEHTEAPRDEYSGPDPDMRYAVFGDRLVLRYLSFPADAPVPTTRAYTRQR